MTLAVGVNLFFISNSITTGGTPGMALLLHHVLGLSIGSIVLLINLPLLALGAKQLGKTFAIRTVFSIILVSAFIDLFALILPNQSITEQTLLAAVFGGALIGIGVGFILRGQSSSGGSTIIAKLVCARTEFKPGQVILAIDAMIIFASIFVFKDVDKVLWSIISIYITSRLVDVMLTGGPSTKVVHITTAKATELSKIISVELKQDGTLLSGKNLGYDNEKDIIFIVIEPKHLRKLRNIIAQHDPLAFMIVMEASEMLGRGH